MHLYTLPHPTAFERKLAQVLGGTKKLAAWKIFPNGENFVLVKNLKPRVAVLGRSHPPGDNFFQTLLLVDTLKRSGAKKIIVWLPYFGYSRQDRQLIKGESVAASCLVNALRTAGATTIITLDLHSSLTANKSPIPLKSISFMSELAQALANDLRGLSYTILSPDRGGTGRAMLFARNLGYSDKVAWIEKNRTAQGTPHALSIHGKLNGETAVLVDDLLDTGRTISEAVKILRRRGFKKFFLCITHPVFSNGAAKLVRSLKFDKILTSNTLPLSYSIRSACRIKVLDATRCLTETR